MHTTLRSLVAVSVPLALSACAGMGMPKAPEVPAAIAVPGGSKPAFIYKGTGLLNYECRTKTDASGAEWVLASPEAALHDDKGAIVGKYYGGPTWEHGDGSKVTGKQVAVSPSPATGNIPWQLVQANPATGGGAFQGVTFIQRVNTNAGVAPSEPCMTASVGKKAQVRYAADYVFYKG